jgi:hypothetical protein
MRTRPTLAIAGAAALAAALIAGAVTAPAAPTSPRSATERYYVSETWHAFSGTPGKGKPTDVYTFQSELTTQAGKRTGMVNGYAINLRPPFVAWTLTAIVAGGTLTMASIVNQEGTPRVLMISGGTGRYLGAAGTVRLTDAGDRGDLAVVMLEARSN